jgi:hypothetical protein
MFPVMRRVGQLKMEVDARAALKAHLGSRDRPGEAAEAKVVARRIRHARWARRNAKVRPGEGAAKETVMGRQRQSSSIRHQREMLRKLKAAEEQAKRQSRATDKHYDRS